MEEYIQKIEGWMNEVKDDETNVEDYGFLKEAATGGNTLANIGSYLAVYETEDGLYVDDDLLEALDQRKTEVAKEQSSSPSHIKERTNHREAIYGDLDGEEKQNLRNNEKTIHDLRDDGEIEEGLLDGGFNGQNSGHGFVKNMIKEFKENSNYEEASPDDDNYSEKSIESNDDLNKTREQEKILPSGGVKIMTDYEELTQEINSLYESLDSVEQGLQNIPDMEVDSNIETLSDEVSDVRDYVSRIESALEIAQSETEEMEETIIRDDQILETTANTLGSITEKVREYGDILDDYMDSQEEVTESLTGALDTLQEIGGSHGYEGPTDEVRQIMDDRLDDEGFEEFQEAASRFE